MNIPRHGQIVLALFVAMVGSWAWADVKVVSSDDLIRRAAEYDGRRVIYEGELIGAILGSGPHVWLNLKDADNGISVWTTRESTAGIDHAGGYKTRGDWIQVDGVFHRACPDHGGGLDIHAERLVVLRPGAVLPEEIHTNRIKAIFYLAGVFLCLWIFQTWNSRRSRS